MEKNKNGRGKNIRFFSIFLLIILINLFPSCSNREIKSASADRNLLHFLPEGNSFIEEENRINRKKSNNTSGYTVNDNIFIYSKGITSSAVLAANIIQPEPLEKKTLYPALLFLNSWGMEEHEYIAKTIYFAKKGYIVLSYSLRGWGLSTGKIACGSPDDWYDFSRVLDWLLNHYPVDPENIGVCGISLGGGTSLLALEHDPRVKTAAVLSSFTDFAVHFWNNQTPKLIWGNLLIGSGIATSKMDQEIFSIFSSTLNNKNIEEVKTWCNIRSPITYIDKINKANKPVYMSQNFEDYLFTPETAIKFFNSLAIDHKHLDLNLGAHFTGEISGLFGLPNYVFANVEKWFDYWLKGIKSDIIPESKKSFCITMEIKGSNKRAVYSALSENQTNIALQWPDKKIKEKRYFLIPGISNLDSLLSEQPRKSEDILEIQSSVFTGLTPGAIILPILQQIGIPVITYKNFFSSKNTLFFSSGSLKKEMKIRGQAKIQISLSLKQPKGQIICYLYDQDSSGKLTYITHGYYTFWDAKPEQIFINEIQFIAIAYDLPINHKLCLIIDTGDPLYGKPCYSKFFVNFHFTGSDYYPELLIPVEE